MWHTQPIRSYLFYQIFENDTCFLFYDWQLFLQLSESMTIWTSQILYHVKQSRTNTSFKSVTITFSTYLYTDVSRHQQQCDRVQIIHGGKRVTSTEAQHLIIGLFGSTSSNLKLVRSVGGPLLSVVPQRVSQKWLVMYTLHKSWHHSLHPPAWRKIPGKTAYAEQLLVPELSLNLTPTVPAETLLRAVNILLSSQGVWRPLLKVEWRLTVNMETVCCFCLLLLKMLSRHIPHLLHMEMLQIQWPWF